MANPALISMLGHDSFDDLSKRDLSETGFNSDYPRERFMEIMKKDGIITCYEGTVEDVTVRKIAEQEAEASDRLKTAFMNNISHELRNLLNGIIGFAEIIVQSELTNHEKEQFISFIKVSSDRLIKTITNYVDSLSIVTGNVKISRIPFSLFRMMEELKYRYKTLCDKKGLIFSLEVSAKDQELMLNSDDDLLIKAPDNLLDNAIKFTHNYGHSFAGNGWPGSHPADSFSSSQLTHH